MRTSVLDRLLQYATDAECPKCGSHALFGPYYHSGVLGHFWHFVYGLLLFRFCRNRAMDHFHYKCMTCSVWHMRACRDIKGGA